MPSEWIKENIIDKGVENVRFFAQMETIDFIIPCFGLAVTSSSNSTWTECKIDESRYKVTEGYKITLKSLDERFTYNHYYQSDFESLIKSGSIIVKDNDLMRVEHIKWAEQCGSVMIVHEADIIVEGGTI